MQGVCDQPGRERQEHHHEQQKHIEPQEDRIGPREPVGQSAVG